MSFKPMNITRLKEGALALRRGSSVAAATDVAYCGNYPVLMYPGDRKKLPTGWAFEMPADVGMLILPRSGLSTNHSLRPENSPGLLDPDYRGELFIALEHYGRPGVDQPYEIQPGEFIAQLMFVPYYTPMFNITNVLTRTERGDGGFGSTEARGRA